MWEELVHRTKERVNGIRLTRKQTHRHRNTEEAMEKGKEMEERILTKCQSPMRLILFCARLWAKETTLVIT